MSRISVSVIEGACAVLVHGRQRISSSRIPIPERQSEGVVLDEASQNALMKVEIPPMPREEEPRIVHLILNTSAILIVSRVTEGTMSVGLLVELSGVIRGQFTKELVSFIVFGDVIGIDEVSRLSETHGERGRELEISDGSGDGKATIDGGSTITGINGGGALFKVRELHRGSH